MRRKSSILPIIIGLVTVLSMTAVPHHHHQSMVCIAKEACELDGCCDGGHSDHSCANHDDEDGSHCTAHKKYFPSDNLRLDFLPMAVTVVRIQQVPSDAQPNGYPSRQASKAHHKPPLLSWRINC